MQKLNEIFFYQLEKAIKSYRRYVQARFKDQGFGITVDQWLVLKALSENAKLTQSDLAELVFKDKASMTRLIELLVLKKLVQRAAHETSRRRFKLTVTDKGHELIVQIIPLIKDNRKHGLRGINFAELQAVEQILKKIIDNCTN
ncbi:MAG: MarR family transcriptional regulator [Bacteroidota bacterium]|nr:MarR family transcriptional regulator [Bacteroidota bacterium]